jgi:hypothetical protein
MNNLFYFTDIQRHLVCLPYSKENLHKMAADLGIKLCWFHKDHYDVPKKLLVQVRDKSIFVSPKIILEIIKGRGS